jgi:putative membrane protein
LSVIVKDKTDWLRMLFSVRGSSFEDTWPRIAAATLVSIAITIIEKHFHIERLSLTTTPFTLIGVALGIFLGFRNNAAYDRFWEGRKLWGSLVNTSRSLTRQIFSLTRLPDPASIVPEEQRALDDFRRRFAMRVIAFAHALRHHLRDSDPRDDLIRFLDADDVDGVMRSRNRPLSIQQELGRSLGQARDRGWLHDVGVAAIDLQLVELSNIQGACERIKNTPIPFTYTVLIHRIVAFYCFALPFGLIETVGVLTPLVVFLISHAFFGLDAIGDEIEQPFGVLPNHLPLASISRTIEINLLELIGETNLPEPLQPQDRVLL